MISKKKQREQQVENLILEVVWLKSENEQHLGTIEGMRKKHAAEIDSLRKTLDAALEGERRAIDVTRYVMERYGVNFEGYFDGGGFFDFELLAEDVDKLKEHDELEEAASRFFSPGGAIMTPVVDMRLVEDAEVPESS